MSDFRSNSGPFTLASALVVAFVTGCSDAGGETAGPGGNAGVGGLGAAAGAAGQTGAAGSAGGSAGLGGSSSSGGSAGSAGTAGTAGTGGAPVADGGGPDTPEETTHSVTVTIGQQTSGGKPVDLLVSDAKGGVYEVTQTDANGSAVVKVPSGGEVSAFLKVTQTSGGVLSIHRAVYTVAAITEDQPFILNTNFMGLNWPDAGKLTFVPTGPLPAGTQWVRVSVPCRGSSANVTATGPIEFPPHKNCLGAKPFYAVAFALDVNGDVIATSRLDNLVSTTAPATHYVKFDGSAQFINAEAHILLPPDLKAARVGVHYGNAPDEYATIEQSSMQESLSQSVFKLPVVTTGFDQYRVEETVDFLPLSDGLTRRTRRARVLSSMPALSSFQPLSIARFANVTKPDFADPKRPSVSWQLESGGAQDCIWSIVAWTKTTPELTQWLRIQRASASGKLKLPALPSSLDEYAPAAGDKVGGATLVHTQTDVKCGDWSTTPKSILMSVSERSM